MEQKLENQELEQLKQLQQKTQEILLELGQIYFNQFLLEEKKSKSQDKILEIREEEKTLKEFLIKKYGDIDINLETGIFTKTSN